MTNPAINWSYSIMLSLKLFYLHTVDASLPEHHFGIEQLFILCSHPQSVAYADLKFGAEIYD